LTLKYWIGVRATKPPATARFSAETCITAAGHAKSSRSLVNPKYLRLLGRFAPREIFPLS
jgi:hypothetical protein